MLLGKQYHPVGQIEKYGEAADDILLGPQVRYELKNVKMN